MANGTVVSIQLVGMEYAPWEGHLTAGVLANPHTVLAPHPPKTILNAAKAYEALIIPADSSLGQQVERIRIAAIDAARHMDSGQVTSATLELAYPSKLQPLTRRFDACRLAEAMAKHGDLWQALEDCGAIEPGSRDIPRSLLQAVPEIERAQREVATRVHEYRDASAPVFNICRIIKWCKPCQPT